MAEINVEFAKQKYLVILSNRAYGDLEYKQRKNWNSKNRIQRERANLMFSRINEGLYNLANDITPTMIVPTGRANEYAYRFSDGFGRIIFQVIQTRTDPIIYVIDFIWDYKRTPSSWWSIVEEKRMKSIIKETINNYLKKNLLLAN